MIDYFTLEEMYHFQYAIISAGVINGGRVTNVAKISQLYPTPEIITAYAEHHDKKILEKMYFDLLDTSKDKDDFMGNNIYKTFVNPLLQHYDIVIVCKPEENDYIDVLCKFLKKKFFIEVIDLNTLFKEGRVGSIYIDRTEIRDNIVELRRKSVHLERESLETTRDGRLKLIQSIMSKKDKIKKLHDLGIEVRKNDEPNLDRLLIDAWVDDDE